MRFRRTRQAIQIGRAIGRRQAWSLLKSKEENIRVWIGIPENGNKNLEFTCLSLLSYRGISPQEGYELGTHDIRPGTPLWSVAERAARRSFEKKVLKG